MYESTSGKTTLERQHCRLLLTLLSIPLLVTAVTAGCTSDVDCSLAGSCVSGECKCEAWTKGDDCAALNLVPLDSVEELG